MEGSEGEGESVEDVRSFCFCFWKMVLGMVSCPFGSSIFVC